MRLVVPLWLLVVAIFMLAAAGCSGSREGEQADLGALLDRVVEAGAPGVFVVLREDNRTRTEARGLSHDDRALRADERFRIASVTKTFVAALVLQLVEGGKLQLDDTVERWLPGLVPNGRAITVRQLLNHTSGLYDYVEEPSVLRSPQRRWTPEELVGLATAHPVEHAGKRRFSYSSTNYLLLGRIAEKAGGAPLESQLRQRLFVPLGLRRTSFEPGLVRGAYVHGHRPPAHNGVVTGPPEDTSDEPARWAWAAAGMVSTADDLQQFFSALLEGRVIGTALLREMETVVSAGRLDYGLGIAAFRTPCGTAWGHTGNAQGTITVAWNTADASRQLVLVVNTYPLSSELETAVRELQDAAFCS
jgi:D-alanyl-D-alanine carboxypeptidase